MAKPILGARGAEPQVRTTARYLTLVLLCKRLGKIIASIKREASYEQKEDQELTHDG